MKKQLVLLAAALVLFGCGKSKTHPESGKNAEAGESKALKAYQAEYSMNAGFYSREWISTDGNGHLRQEIAGAEGSIAPRVVTVLDSGNGQVTAWAVGTNKYAKRPASPTDPICLLNSSLQYQGGAAGEALGSKTIDGHKCHGWKSEMGIKVWKDDDYGCVIATSSGNMSKTLVNFSGTAPDPSQFQPPADYVDASPPGTAGGGENQFTHRRRRNFPIMH